MNQRLSSPSLPLAFFVGLLLATLALSAHAGPAQNQAPAHAPAGVLVPVDAKTDATWLTKARVAYPLDRCPVCDDKIEATASSNVPEYIYRVAGKPDRLVRFCNDAECVPSFKKDPDKYLQMTEETAATKTPVPSK